MPESRRYILLPREGVYAQDPRSIESLTSLPIVKSTDRPQNATLRADGSGALTVIDTLREDGPKLVEMDVSTADEIANGPESPIRALPEITYSLPDPLLMPSSTPSPADAGTRVTVSCVDAVSGEPLPSVYVVAFADFESRAGDDGMTSATGAVSLNLPSETIERLYAYAPGRYWGAFRRDLSTASSIELPIEPVDLGYVDAVRRYYGASSFDVQARVRVGVLDTGVGPHRDLEIVTGSNTVTGENRFDFNDPNGHGTHVAGLIGSGGAPPTGLRGVAPGVDICAYRVFSATGRATNYAILKAMFSAEVEQCDIINLSLGGGPFDPIVEEAIQAGRNRGMLIVIAAGNDGRRPVAYPAAHRGATAVSAMGHADSFPPGSLPGSDIERPPLSTQDSKEFIASFSNIGPEIAITGPGVGVLSTLPNDEFGPMSGTSMAAPVVAGAAASLLSQDPVILGMTRDRNRSEAIERLLQSNCLRRGFGNVFEGYGMPDPNAV